MTLPILVVDDDPDTGKMMAKVFSAWGYQTKVAQDGPTALDLVAQHEFGIAIIDYRMPGMNGVELFHKMRDACPDLAAVFLTGHARLDVVFPAIKAGARRAFETGRLTRADAHRAGAPGPHRTPERSAELDRLSLTAKELNRIPAYVRDSGRMRRIRDRGYLAIAGRVELYDDDGAGHYGDFQAGKPMP